MLQKSKNSPYPSLKKFWQPPCDRLTNRPIFVIFPPQIYVYFSRFLSKNVHLFANFVQKCPNFGIFAKMALFSSVLRGGSQTFPVVVPPREISPLPPWPTYTENVSPLSKTLWKGMITTPICCGGSGKVRLSAKLKLLPQKNGLCMPLPQHSLSMKWGWHLTFPGVAKIRPRVRIFNIYCWFLSNFGLVFFGGGGIFQSSILWRVP